MLLHKAHLHHAKGGAWHPVLQQAIVGLASLKTPPIEPQDMGLLVSGTLLVLCWHYLAYQGHSFDAQGLGSLVQMWLVAMVALAVGQVVRLFAPTLEPDADAADHWGSLALAAAVARAANSSSGSAPTKEGRETFVVPPPGLEGPAPGHEDEEDMAVVKRRAQAEAAAKLERYRADVQQLLAAVSAAAQAGTAPDPHLLLRLAEPLFDCPMHLSEFVMLGGLPVVMGTLQSLAGQLASQQQQQQQVKVLKALLQASWVVLQLAHGPPACRAALEEPQTAEVLLSAAQAVAQLPPGSAPAAGSILRNLWWTLLTMCDGGPQSFGGRGGGVSAHHMRLAQHKRLVLQQLVRVDVVSHLQQLVTLQHGPSAGWMAAAQLGLLVQLGHDARQQEHEQDQQDQQQTAASLADTASLAALSAAAVQAMLQPDSLAGLGFLLQHQQAAAPQPPAPQQQQQQQQPHQLSGRVKGLVEGLLHYLLTFHAPQLLQLLVEGRLVGCFAAHSCLRLGRLLVCQLLSSRGQAVLSAVESEFELDVPLALAQVIPLKVHIKLPAAPQPQQPRQHQERQHEQQGGGEIVPAADDAEEDHQQQQQQDEVEEVDDGSCMQGRQLSVQAAMAADTYTNVMAGGLLLQHDRLHELLVAFCEELSVAQQQQQHAAAAAAAAAAGSSATATVAPAAQQQQPAAATDAVLGLVRYVMTRDLQLHVVQHVRGDGVAASICSSSSSSGSSSIDAALAMPDSSGAYSRVMAGLVPDSDLPVGPSSSDTSDSGNVLLTLPLLPVAAAEAQQQGQGRQQVGVVFQFGALRHAVDAATWRGIKQASPFLRSLLRQAGSGSSGDACVVTVLRVPRFTDAANVWVVRCLERWLDTGALAGFSALQAAQLWVAADFLQVNALQVACEDVMVAAFGADPSLLSVALELCARHPEPNGRLLRLLAQQLLHNAAAPGSAEAAGAGGANAPKHEAAPGQEGGVAALQQLLLQHHALLLPVVRDELRDRLLTLCIQNADLDADSPDEPVG